MAPALDLLSIAVTKLPYLICPPQGQLAVARNYWWKNVCQLWKVTFNNNMIKWNLDYVSLIQVRLQNDLKTWHDSKFSLSVLGP